MFYRKENKVKEITNEKWLLVNVLNREICEIYLNSTLGLSEKTLKQYKTCLRQFFFYVFERENDKAVYDVTRDDFLKYIYYMKDLKLSSNAIKLRKYAVSSLCNYIENILLEEIDKVGYINDVEGFKHFNNFTRNLSNLKHIQNKGEKLKEIKYITENEYSLMIKILQEKRDYLGLAWVVTAYNTNANREELTVLKVRELVNLKDADVLGYIEQWINKRKHDSDYVFSVKYGGRIKPISLNWANEFCKKILTPIIQRRVSPKMFKRL